MPAVTNASGKVVLVTGASSGIGQACARHLAACGYRVFGAQRRVAAERDGGVEMLTMDVTDDESVRRGVATVLERAGRIDAVLNNAGNAVAGAIEDTAIEEARAQLETNFFGVLRVCRAVLPHMRERGGGYVINVSSLAGVLGLPFNGLYSASKFALEGMTESLRLETRRFGIRVVLVEPGDFKSNLPTARRVAEDALRNPAYRDAFDRFKAQQDRDEGGAPTPEPVARLVARILETPNPRLRYTVGMMSQRVVSPLKRLLPQRLFESTLVRVLGL